MGFSQDSARFLHQPTPQPRISASLQMHLFLPMLPETKEQRGVGRNTESINMSLSRHA
jgi:hypothetical protein